MRILIAVLSLMLATTTYGQDADAEVGIEFCNWLSELARDVMAARQRSEPMSEILPFALDRLEHGPEVVAASVAEYLSILADDDREESLAKLEDIFEQMRPLVTGMVKGAYEIPVQALESNRRTVISEWEDQFFSSCYPDKEETEAD
ncbi:MAG: hypothetical protein KJO09_02965 [Gammaproteobacteria bacterium]|nr:hypothetical protein [Gammaproteobacteria bacterium]